MILSGMSKRAVVFYQSVSILLYRGDDTWWRRCPVGWQNPGMKAITVAMT